MLEDERAAGLLETHLREVASRWPPWSATLTVRSSPKIIWSRIVMRIRSPGRRSRVSLGLQVGGRGAECEADGSSNRATEHDCSTITRLALAPLSSGGRQGCLRPEDQRHQ